MSELDGKAVVGRARVWVSRFFAFFMLIALIPVGIGGYMAWQSYRAVAGGERVEAVVVDRAVSQTYDGMRYDNVYAPIFEFTTSDGVTRRARAAIFSNLSDLPNGTQRSVWFDPATPDVVRIDSPWSLYGVALITALPGLISFTVLLVVRGFILRLMRRVTDKAGPIRSA
jgi:hypothetical protein